MTAYQGMATLRQLYLGFDRGEDCCTENFRTSKTFGGLAKLSAIDIVRYTAFPGAGRRVNVRP